MSLPGIDLYQLSRLLELTLKEIGLYSPEVKQLLLRTTAQESRMGHYIKQLGSGPALGIFQVEPRTFWDHINWLTAHKPVLFRKILEASGIGAWIVEMHELKRDKRVPDFVKKKIPNNLAGILYPEMMMFNLKFAICIARVHYLRTPGEIPKDIESQWSLYKMYYNSMKGAATREEFMRNSKLYKI